MGKYVLIILSFICLSCEKENDCIKEIQHDAIACSTAYVPVCGCDQETYPSACDARNAGVKSWTEGECEN